MELNTDSTHIAIIGLGYVGLPLALEFSKKYKTVGFDVNENRVKQLKDGKDRTGEASAEELSAATELSITGNINDLDKCNIYIVTVPTPIDLNKQPDLTPLIKASEMLGPLLRKNNIVIYESTVYPGVTEDICVPLLETGSKLRYNTDFFAGYSPERINPGDKLRRLVNIQKVTSGSTPDVANIVDELYKSIITAGTHKAQSIKVAEASKVIENVQRDVNIALINELHQVFNNLGINTKDVIDAASTKWNFMKLMPGMVGGHCISVDPYYLLHKSENAGYIPDLMRTAREINNGMPKYFANDFLRELVIKGINPVKCKVLLLGFTFKEDCPDTRNTKVYDLYKVLKGMGLNVSIYDPWVIQDEVRAHYNIDIINDAEKLGKFDAGFLTVGHTSIINDLEREKITFSSKFIYDYKSIING